MTLQAQAFIMLAVAVVVQTLQELVQAAMAVVALVATIQTELQELPTQAAVEEAVLVLALLVRLVVKALLLFQY
jgi:hypothetical protein